MASRRPCTTGAAADVPSRLRADGKKLARVVTTRCKRLSVELECLTGTVAI